VNPTATLVIIDRLQQPGGVWAPQNHYTGLRTNNILGTYEFSDVALAADGATYGVPAGAVHAPGEAVGKYLAACADRWDLRRRMRCGIEVVSAEKIAEGWRVVVTRGEGGDDGDDKEEVLDCAKLVVATGLTARPRGVTLAGADEFAGELLPFHGLPAAAGRVCADQETQRVVVMGGSKAGYDAAYLFATEGKKKVDWVISRSGFGPTWMAPPFVGPGRAISLEKVTTARMAGWFCACVWEGEAWLEKKIRRWLHGTWLGGILVRAFYGGLEAEVRKVSGLDAKEMKGLMPDAR
jgi:cation diffusion facilitator CzcD-associated flavoprotein CzcO